MLGKVFKAYDIRATHPKPLTAKLAWQIGYGTARYLLDRAEEAGFDDPMMRHIVVGRDMRKSSPELCDALKRGMRDCGASVIDVGLVDTPFITFAINHLGCCGGVQTTASHNPANYNGFKISGLGARPVGESTGLADIRRHAAMTGAEKQNKGGGRDEARDLWPAYREHVLTFLDPAILSGERRIRVAVDASNGMAGTMMPKVFKGVKGLDLVELNFDNSKGEFRHEPNPLVEENLKDLREAVVAKKAHLGVCFDGDADRCVVVDESGATIGCDILTAWIARHLLAREHGAIVYDLRSSRALGEIVTESGGAPIRSRVGHVFMKQVMREHNALFGGELSGHFYFRENWFADSGAIAFATVLGVHAAGEGPLSARIASLRRYAQSGEINFETENKEAALAALRAAYPDAEVETLDGITLSLRDWWCNVRPSNTEPLLRLNLEARTAEQVTRLVGEVSTFLGKRVRH